MLRIVMAAGLESGAGSRPCGSDCSWAEGPTSVTKARRCDRLVMKLRSRGSPAAAAARLPLQHKILSRCWQLSSSWRCTCVADHYIKPASTQLYSGNAEMHKVLCSTLPAAVIRRYRTNS